jgi:acetyl esterase
MHPVRTLSVDKGRSVWLLVALLAFVFLPQVAEARSLSMQFDQQGGDSTPPSSSDAKSPIPIPSDIEFEQDISYGTADGEALLLDAYLPDVNEPAPALVMIHGGGFVGGDKYNIEPIAVYFAEHGYACFSINYRLAPGFAYPAAVEDARNAVTFIRSNAARFNVDLDRIGAFGASAGGTIAASLGVEGSGPLNSDSRVAVVVTWSAAFDFSDIIPNRPAAVGALEKYAGILGKHQQRLVPPAQEKDLLAKASPVTYVTSDDPAFFIVNSQVEFMPLDQAQEMASTLQRQGVHVEMLTDTHGHALNYTEQAEPPSLRFLDAQLRSFEPPPQAQGTQTPGSSPSRSPEGIGSFGRIAIIAGGVLVLVILGGLLRWFIGWRRDAVYRR